MSTPKTNYGGRARGRRRILWFDGKRQTITVELTAWLRLFRWRSKIKRGKRKGERLDPAITFPLADLRRATFSPAWGPFGGKLTLDAPGHNDHWTPTGRQRKHKIRYSGWRAPEFARMVFALELLSPPGTVVVRGFGRRRLERLRDTMTPAVERGVAAARRRRGRVIRQLSDERKRAIDPVLDKAAATLAAPAPTPAPRQNLAPDVPERLVRAARTADGRRRAAGMPPPGTTSA